jgi:hypothetical protein
LLLARGILPINNDVDDILQAVDVALLHDRVEVAGHESKERVAGALAVVGAEVVHRPFLCPGKR